MHGKKKWIKDYKGRLKKSSDRTYKDWLADLNVWEPYVYAGRWYMRYGKKEGKNFCPQCKHNAKDLIKEVNDWEEINNYYQDLYNEEYKSYEKTKRNHWLAWVERTKFSIHEVYYDHHFKRFPYYWEWLKQNNHYVPPRPFYDERTYLCTKCRHKFDTKRNMWSKPFPGMKENHTWRRRETYRKYRAKVKIVMQKAKYDEEYWDDIPVLRREWLD